MLAGKVNDPKLEGRERRLREVKILEILII